MPTQDIVSDIKHLRSTGRTQSEIAQEVGVAQSTVCKVLKGVKTSLKKKDKPQLAESTEEDIKLARLDLKTSEASQATKRYKQLVAQKALEQEIVEDFRETVAEAVFGGWKLPERVAPIPKLSRSQHTPESAVLTISDSHVGKFINPEHTLGFGNYNPWRYIEILQHIENTVINLLKNNIENPIQSLHILFLGDLVEGMLNHAQEVPNRSLIADQAILAATTFYQFVSRLSKHVPKVICRGVGGNHARWPSQKKVPTENRYSNMDYIVLGWIKSLLETGNNPNVQFDLEEAPFQVFDIEGWRFKIGHGDHLKGGDKAMGVPAHAIGRETNATTQRYAAKGLKAPDYYLVGDKHRHISLSTATGRYMVNGAWFDSDDYAMSSNFTPGRPFQYFFGMHPRIGKSWQYDLMLDIAPKLEKCPYALPENVLKKILAFAKK